MKKLKFLVCAFLLTFIISCGQQKRYVTYKVKEGETMRDIAKRLDMKTKDLLRLNPDVGRRPATNTTIIVPNTSSENNNTSTEKEVVTNSEDNKIEGTTKPETPVNEDVNDFVESTKDSIKVEQTIISYKTHTVSKGETVYALTRKYNITKEELIALNPDFKDLRDNKLSIGQVLNVEKQITKKITTKSYTSLEDEMKNFVIHKVQPKETVYSITRFYNISKNDLINLNPHLPNLKDNLLSIGDIIKIRPIEEKLDSDVVGIYTDSIYYGKQINLALLLPFKATNYDSITPFEIFGKGKKSKLVNIVTDFYLGANIAIDSLKTQGVEINATAFDTGNRGKNVTTILAEDKLKDTDVIIGPLYFDKAEIVAKKVNIPVVYPHFSRNQTKFSSGKIIKTAPDIAKYAVALTSYLKSKYNGETIFVVGDGKSKSNLLVSSITSSLKQHDSINDIIVLKPEKNYIKKERFTDKMKPKKHCWVIMTSDDNVAVADALNSMVVLPEDVTAQVFAVDKNNAYDKIDNNKLARMEFAYVTNDFIDETDASTKAFNRKYRQINHTNPSSYAIRGFDVTYDILVRLASGNKLNETFKQGTSFRIGNKFEFNKKLFGATDNNGLFLVQYNKDLTLSRLK